jgi:hypothetical protein
LRDSPARQLPLPAVKQSEDNAACAVEPSNGRRGVPTDLVRFEEVASFGYQLVHWQVLEARETELEHLRLDLRLKNREAREARLQCQEVREALRRRTEDLDALEAELEHTRLDARHSQSHSRHFEDHARHVTPTRRRDWGMPPPYPYAGGSSVHHHLHFPSRRERSLPSGD